MEAQEIKAKYTSKTTAQKYGIDFQGFADSMADYGLKVNVKADYVEVIEADPECFAFGEVVDTANYILIWDAAAGKLHVTHVCVRGTYVDWYDQTVDIVEIWDVDRTEAGKTTIRTNNVRDAVERYITAYYA